MTSEGALPGTAAIAQIEKNLASLGFLSRRASASRAAQPERFHFTRFLDGRKIRAEAVIIPSARHGLPVTSDQDKYLALQRIITDLRRRYGAPPKPDRIPAADLLGILGRQRRSRRHYRRIREWLEGNVSRMKHELRSLEGPRTHPAPVGKARGRFDSSRFSQQARETAP